jgi:phosphoglycerate dehydrogenase-like enzyme
MEKPRILITTYYLTPGDEVDRRLREAGYETLHHPMTGGRTEEELLDLLTGVVGAIASSDPFSARVIEAAKSLRVISRTGVGYDAVDVAAATDRGIVVTTTPGVNRNAVADWTMALLLCCARRVKENLTEVERGGWARHEGCDLAEKTLGIVGLGAIGKEVATRARAFRMRLLAFDIVRDLRFAEAQNVSYVDLGDLLSGSDFVSLHLPLDPLTRHFIGAEQLDRMKPTAYLINTARGGIVDTGALFEALREKRIAGAALDVVEDEPLPADSPLRGLPNVYLSPHVGGSTVDARRLSSAMAVDNLIAGLKGERPEGIVNPEVLGR